MSSDDPEFDDPPHPLPEDATESLPPEIGADWDPEKTWVPDEGERLLPSDPDKTWVPEERAFHILPDTENLPNPPAETEPGSSAASSVNEFDDDDVDDLPEESEPPPRRFGDYELLEKVGAGGMGTVYKAHHLRLDRIVALKMLKGKTAQIEHQLERFVREAKAAARLDHPNIVTCHEFGEFNGWHYIAMAFVEGESLHQRLARGPLEPSEAARLVHALAGAVAHAHQQNVIHRDIKPGNVILGKDGRPRLTDFGIAKIISRNDTPLMPTHLTQVGQALGTPGYMAPEQSAGRRWEIGPSADIYGLGGVLHAALTGAHPGDPNSFETLTQEIPEALQTICDRCLAYRPQDRFATAQQLEKALADYLGGVSGASPQSPAPTQDGAARFDKRIIYWGLAVAAIAAIAFSFLNQ